MSSAFEFSFSGQEFATIRRGPNLNSWKSWRLLVLSRFGYQNHSGTFEHWILCRPTRRAAALNEGEVEGADEGAGKETVGGIELNALHGPVQHVSWLAP